jgi:7-carboxy-7-deazaguanine synthase
MLRLLEHYTAPQGEGPNVGIMSQFVRFAGCNLKCPGWPCDTPQAIDPKLFTREQQHVTATDVVNKIMTMYAETGAKNIVFTGGEPMIQSQEDLFSVVSTVKPLVKGATFEVFTNGTRSIAPDLISSCTFVMDWKLPGSGEPHNQVTRIRNVPLLNGPLNAVKFVIAESLDLVVAMGMYNQHLRDTMYEVFVGAAWEKYSNEDIFNFVTKNRLPWRLNVQVHNYIFGAHRRYT